LGLDEFLTRSRVCCRSRGSAALITQTVPNRHVRHFPADLRPHFSRSAAIRCFIHPSDGGPRVRILLPPPASQLRTCQPDFRLLRPSGGANRTPPRPGRLSRHITPATRDNPAGCQTGHPAGLSEPLTFSRALPDQHPVTSPSRVFVVAVLKLVPRSCRGSGRSARLYALGDAGPSVPARELRALRHCGGKVCGSE
jgi:hypothetical protein